MTSLTGTTRLKRIQLVANEVYRTHPELVPFNDGDRAEQVGELSATQHAALKMIVSESKHFAGVTA